MRWGSRSTKMSKLLSSSVLAVVGVRADRCSNGFFSHRSQRACRGRVSEEVPDPADEGFWRVSGDCVAAIADCAFGFIEGKVRVRKERGDPGWCNVKFACAYTLSFGVVDESHRRRASPGPTFWDKSTNIKRENIEFDEMLHPLQRSCFTPFPYLDKPARNRRVPRCT